MKTFQEFILEKYYEPDQPLPSGKTPYGKATSSYYRQKGEYFRGGKSKPLNIINWFFTWGDLILLS